MNFEYQLAIFFLLLTRKRKLNSTQKLFQIELSQSFLFPLIFLLQAKYRSVFPNESYGVFVLGLDFSSENFNFLTSFF